MALCYTPSAQITDATSTTTQHKPQVIVRSCLQITTSETTGKVKYSQ